MTSSLLDRIVGSYSCDDGLSTTDISLEESHHRFVQMHIIDELFDDTLLCSREGEGEEGGERGDEGVIWFFKPTPTLPCQGGRLRRKRKILLFLHQAMELDPEESIEEETMLSVLDCVYRCREV